MAKTKQDKAAKTSGFPLWNNMRLQIVVLVILSFILYGKALKFGFNYLDDSILVIDKYKFNSDYHNIPKAFNQHIFKVDEQVDK
jgi:hypothetical protein